MLAFFLGPFGQHLRPREPRVTGNTERQMHEYFYPAVAGWRPRGAFQKAVMRKRGYFPAAVLTALASLVALSCGEVARAGTLVDFNFANFGTVQVDLFDDLTPATVTNFLSYANSGAFTNTIIHRSVANFVIQGGGFNTQFGAITTSPPIALEYSRANTRGTIAMARTTDPNSATRQWFFNTVDNTGSLGPGLNGPGYAVFGWVLTGMSAVDNIAALPTFAFASPFAELPLRNYTQTDFNNHTNPTSNNQVTLSSITVVGTHPSFQNPVAVDDVNNDGALHPLDALNVINDLLANGTHTLNGPFSGTNYLDTSGDGKVSPLDALNVINALLAIGGGAAPAMSAAAMPNMSGAAMPNMSGAAMPNMSGAAMPSPMMSPMTVVPEPSSFVLAGAGTLALAGYVLGRRMGRKRVVG
jgi:peptidyl-prolyl cis-trans isomerase A (cyclophilin A)